MIWSKTTLIFAPQNQTLFMTTNTYLVIFSFLGTNHIVVAWIVIWLRPCGYSFCPVKLCFYLCFVPNPTSTSTPFLLFLSFAFGHFPALPAPCYDH